MKIHLYTIIVQMIGNSYLAIKNTKEEIHSVYRLNQNQRSRSLRSTKMSSKKQTKIITNQKINHMTNCKQKGGYRYASPCKSNAPLRGSKLSQKTKGQRSEDKTIRKTPTPKQKTIMKSLNITHLTPYSEEFTRSNSQQLPTNRINYENLFNFNTSLMKTFFTTEKILDEYQKTCNLLKKQNKKIKRQYLEAKNQILQLKRHPSLKKSKE